MSQMAASYTYLGPWINWSHGAIIGSTITLSERNGELLTAFLAMFVTAAGAACWRTISYALHQHRVRQEYQDGLHHQTQSIFRNTNSSGGASWELARLIWYWRKHAVKPLVRTLPVLALALLNLVLFGLAGIFSSEVTRAAGNETLLRSPNCGMLDLGASQSDLMVGNNLDLNETLAATTYSRACYSDTPNNLQCNQYTQRSLPWKTNRNASCPFDNELCFYGSTSAYEMDSGLLDSHEALGINARTSDRVQLRKLTTCSPIHTKGHLIELNVTNKNDPLYGDTLAQYAYGPVGTLNYTFQYNTHSLLEDNGYALASFLAMPINSPDGWTPIVALNRTDADVSLFLLAPNSVLYVAPVADPFFAASLPIAVPNLDGTNTTFYTADQYVSAIACIDQYQYCNPKTGRCTSLTSVSVLNSNLDQLDDIDLNVAQLNTAEQIGFAVPYMGTFNSVLSRGAQALRASETVDNNIQIALPDDQWMTEVSSWYAVSMAKLQQKIVQYAIGPAYTPAGVNVTAPLNDAQERICKNQKIRSASGTISFSVLGVAIILIVGAMLIFTNLVLDTLMGFIRRKLHWKDYKRLQWTLDEKLQMQRLAYEEAGQGHWSGAVSSVPVTRKHDTFGIPRDVDATHPRLGRVQRQSGAYGRGTPEAVGLMNEKGMEYTTEPVLT